MEPSMKERTMISTLEGVSTGTYHVTTESNSVYTIDLDNKTATRHGEVPVIKLSTIPGPEDDVPMHYFDISGPTVGQHMFLEGHHGWRRTTRVVSIEQEES
jgi:hypothetical protein